MQHKALRKRRDKPWIAATVILVLASFTLLGVFTLVKTNSEKLASDLSAELVSTNDPVQDDTPDPNTYVVEAAYTPAAEYIKQISAFVPSGYNPPTVKSVGTASTFVSWVCGNFTLSPAPILGSQMDLTDRTSVIVQAYGAGQVTKSLESYRNGVAKCADRNGRADIIQKTPIGVEATGFSMSFTSEGQTAYATVWSRGDSMLAVSAPDRDTLASIVSQYDAAAQEALAQTACFAINLTPADVTRSPYYDPASYTGWQRGREVSIPENSFGVNLGILSPDNALAGQGPRMGQLDMGMLTPQDGVGLEIAPSPKPATRPEDPLPADFPAELPAAVTKPNQTVGNAPAATATSTVIPERVPDPEGPGCGWVWSGQKAPHFDNAQEKAKVDAVVGSTEEGLRSAFAQYIADSKVWYNTYLSYSSSVTSWNNYANSVTAISQQWTGLNNVRAEYRRKLDAYYQAIKDRDKFITDQEAAQKAYDEAVAACEVTNATNAANTIGLPSTVPTPDPAAPSPTPQPTVTPTPTPTPTMTPSPTPTPTPERCVAERPVILDQKIPAVPTPPTKPDVPLPASWTDVP